MESYLSNYELNYLNQIITDLYSDNNVESACINFMRKIRDLVYFEKGNIYFYKHEKGNYKFQDFISIDWTQAELDKYLNYYYAIDDVLPIISSSQPVMFRCSDVFIENEREKTRYYQELICSIGLHYSVEGNIYIQDNDCFGAIGIHRSDGNKNFTPKELEIIKLMRSHLSNIAKKYYEDKKKTDCISLLPLLSCIKDISICVWDQDMNLMFSNIDNNAHFANELKSEIITRIQNLCLQLKNSNENLSKEIFKTKITLQNHSFWANISCIHSNNYLNQYRFITVIIHISTIFDHILYEIKNKHRLTEREYDVLKYVISGLTNHEICNELFISLPTVKKHLTSIYEKLEIEGKHQILNMLL